jgi:hypothetical protein
MNQTAIDILRQVIKKWQVQRQYTYENKQVHVYKNPMVQDEMVLRFSNSLYSFFCKDKNIEIFLSSEPFFTATIGESSLSDNVNGDGYRLEKHLEEFDELFYQEVERKLSECIDSLTTSDPFLF